MDRFIDFLRAVPRSRAIVSHRSVRHNTGTVPIQIGLPVLQDWEPGPATATGEGFIVISDHYFSPHNTIRIEGKERSRPQIVQNMRARDP